MLVFYVCFWLTEFPNSISSKDTKYSLIQALKNIPFKVGFMIEGSRCYVIQLLRTDLPYLYRFVQQTLLGDSRSEIPN